MTLQPGVRPIDLPLPRSALVAMIRLVRGVHALAQSAAYGQAVAIELPDHARIPVANLGLPMGYDFHLTAAGPRLIEINTNAGGLLLAWLAHHPGLWPDWHGPVPPQLVEHGLRSPLAAAFRQEARLAGVTVQRAVILDDAPEQQFLYPEMVAYRALLRAMGWQAEICSPEQLAMGEDGVFWQGEAVQLIYNRHCDFYLESPAMAGLAAAWRTGKVCLTPHPRVYGLLADKRRLLLLGQEAFLRTMGLEESLIALMGQVIPRCHMLHDMDREQLWRERKQWVLKPVTSFGSRGVILGDSMSRTRFNTLPGDTTLAQALVPPSLVTTDGETLKCDWRLFTYGDKVLTVAARLYQGQVTNLRSAGSGFARVRLV